MTSRTTVLITGCNGFVGKWLADLLLSSNCRVTGIDLQEKSALDGITYHSIDITDAASVSALLAEVKPDRLYHLAGISFLPQADHSPCLAIDTNISGTMALLEGVRTCSPETRTLLVGSSKEYGDDLVSEEVTEETEPRPANFYGISKYAGELIGLQYRRQFGIDVRCTRSFNHTGPGQAPSFVCSDWALQVALIALGRAEPFITVGDLGAEIDFTDVRDVVGAYYAILELGRPGEVYNVASGKSVDLSWILNYLIGKAPLQVSCRYSTEKKREHKSNGKMTGSHRKLTDHTGWIPQIPFERTLDELYEYWMRELTPGRE